MSPWVDATKEWPDDEDQVLAYSDGAYWIAYVDGGVWHSACCGGEISTPSHWMPLPEAPR